jgi:20S proteasome alpha/beta subunit
MKAVKIWLLAAIVSIGACALNAQEQSEIIRGTINVVLGNSHGMVVLTDSAQTLTDQNGRRIATKEGQKLIRLDDRSVCAVAGFGGATISTAPQFNVDIMGIIAEFRDQLAGQQPTPSFELKLRTLSSLVQFYLSAVANLNEVLQPSPIPNQSHTFSLFLVGYDSDGSPKIGVLELVGTLQPQSDGKRSWSFGERMAVFPVGQQLSTALGGVWDAAQQVLSHPENYSANAAVRKYAESNQNDHGASLELRELETLADFLADESSRQHPAEVGGHRQVCVFQDGRIKRLEQPSFPDPPRPLRFNLVVDSRMQGHAIEAPPGVRFLWVRCTLANDPTLRLDDNFFVGSEIRDSVVLYDGGTTLLDKTNKVTNSRLLLGPHADPKSSRVRALVNGFQWANQSDLPK